MSDHHAIDAAVQVFFAAFSSDGDVDDRLDRLRELMLPGAIVVRTDGGGATAYDVGSFIEPRRALLKEGSLTSFREAPVAGRIDLLGHVAQWFGTYEKSSVNHDVPFTGGGAKSIQLVRTRDGWRISAVAWADSIDTSN